MIGVPFDDILFDFDCGSFFTFDDVALVELAGLEFDDEIEGVTFITLLTPSVDD